MYMAYSYAYAYAQSLFIIHLLFINIYYQHTADTIHRRTLRGGERHTTSLALAFSFSAKAKVSFPIYIT